MNRNKEKIQYFSTEDDGTLIKIIVSAVVFHLVVVLVLYGLHCIDLSKPAKEIPVFELVQMDEPVEQSVVETPKDAEAQQKDETSPEEPKQEPPPDETKEESIEPVVENPPPEIPPETPPEPVQEQVTEPVQEPEPTKEPVVEPTPEKAVAPDAPQVPEETKKP